MKTCKRCSSKKMLALFSKDKTRSDGFQPYCKQCVATYKKQYAKKNADKLKEYHKEYRENNRDSLRQYHKGWLENGGRETRHTYRQENKELIKVLKSNGHTKRERCKVDSSLTGTEFKNWIYIQHKICNYCGVDCSDSFHVDHIEPLSLGGEHSLNNLAISCPHCNLSKGSKILVIWLAEQRIDNDK